MADISYPAKTVAGDGGTRYVAGNTVPADELQADFDEVANTVNGQLDENNLSGSTQIPNAYLVDIDGTKVVDHSDNASTAASTTTPGDSATLGSNLATNLEGEIERLRYRIGRNKGYAGTVQYMDSSGSMQNVEWVEEAIRGPNLLVNSGFEVFTGSSGDAPDGWTEVGTLGATSMVDAPDINGTHKRSFQMASNASGEGISQTVAGLKVSTKYLFGVTYYLTTGGVSISATGGLTSGNNYQDPTYTDTTTGAGTVTASVVVKTDSSGSDITVRVLGSTSSNLINVVECWFQEIGDAKPSDVPTTIVQTATDSTEDASLPTTFNTSWDSNWEEWSDLTLSQIVPGPGYRLRYEANVSFGINDAGGSENFACFGFRLVRNDGSDTTVDGPYVFHNNQIGVATISEVAQGNIRLTDDYDTPTPGTTYEYSIEVTAYRNDGQSSRIVLNPNVDPLASGNTIQTASKATLRLERI